MNMADLCDGEISGSEKAAHHSTMIPVYGCGESGFERLKYFFTHGKTLPKQSGLGESKIDEAAFKTAMQKRGITGVIEKLSKDVNDWRNIELHVAVTGSSGSGKSSFINSIRGLVADDKGAAKVGVTETTTVPKDYPHPDNESFVVWDLPGAGTIAFPKSGYIEKVEFLKYDAFIIMSKDRFTEIDAWLAEEVRKQQKSYFFVRAKVDKDIESNCYDHPKTHDEQRVLREILTVTKENLREQNVKDPKVFLISNRMKDEFDFGRLNNELLASCDGLKKDAMALSLAAVTKKVIEEKKRILEERIKLVALIVTSIGSELEQKTKFQEEIRFYQQQFNIDDTTLAENKEMFSLSEENIEGFKVVFDECSRGKKMLVETPTTTRQGESPWQRFKDWFVWTKEKKLLYTFCVTALESNLDILYNKSKELYDVKATKQMVNAKVK